MKEIHTLGDRHIFTILQSLQLQPVESRVSRTMQQLAHRRQADHNLRIETANLFPQLLVVVTSNTNMSMRIRREEELQRKLIKLMAKPRLVLLVHMEVKIIICFDFYTVRFYSCNNPLWLLNTSLPWSTQAITKLVRIPKVMSLIPYVS